jgi:predicted RNase H-like HicB family nuclease
MSADPRRSLTKDEMTPLLCYYRSRRIVNMVREFSVVIERDEDGYFVASVPALRGCHTQAKSLDVLLRRVKEAIQLCLEVEDPVSTEFVGVQRVAVSE